MKYILLLTVFIIVSVTASAQLTTYEKNAQNFIIEKVKLGYTLKSFFKKYPFAIWTGEVGYYDNDLKLAGHGYFEFYENKLYSVSLYYDPMKNENILSFGKTLTAKLGHSHTQDQFKDEEEGIYKVFRWEFDKIKKSFYLTVYITGKVKFSMIDNSVTAAISEAFEKSKTEEPKIDFDF